MKNPIAKIKSSIFTKLVLIVLFAGLFIHILVGGFIQRYFLSERHSAFIKNLHIYVEYIIADIGNPPNFKKAKRIAQETGLFIAISGKNISFASKSAKVDLNRFRFIHFNKNAMLGHKRGKFYYIKNVNGYKYILSPDKRKQLFGFNKHLVILLIMLTVILFLVYIFIRKLLTPVRNLKKGVEEIANGNLEFQLETKSKDELGVLVGSFNDMSKKIHTMLKAREQLLLDVSHELRSPLTRVKVALEFLEDTKAKDSIQGDVSEMETMITEILETERLKNQQDKIEYEEIDLLTIINQVQKELQLSDAHIKVNKIPDNFEILAGKRNVHIVLKNIIENAKKYSEYKVKPIELSFYSNGEYNIIEIKDYGQGIPESAIDLIFEPFYRVDASRNKETGGYGLGMSMCKTIIELYNGSIDIESSPDLFTKVILSFKKVAE